MSFRNYGKQYHRLNPTNSPADIERSKKECDTYFERKEAERQFYATDEPFEPFRIEMKVSRYGKKYHERMKKPKLVKLSPYAKQIWNMKLKHQPQIKHFEG